MDRLTPEQRRRNMQAIRSKGSKAEERLAKALWANGYRYRKNNRAIYGKPDISFKRLKLVVFVDSEFFHGRNWKINKYRIKTNRAFWWQKIEGNIRRDKLVLNKLTSEGWKVLRFWDTDVLKNLEYCITKIEETLRESQNEQKVF